jgi:acyl-CoA synthetase (AMP-forming)/AMP-acid ligase II
LEIEEVIAQFPGVEEVVACAGEDAARGEEICVLVAAQDSLDPAAIRRHCADRLDSWKVPRRFGFLKEIPRNSRGKISRSEIAGMFRPGQAGFF